MGFEAEYVSNGENIFNDIIKKCNSNGADTRLTDLLRERLEEFTREQRKQIVSGLKEGCAPLFIACRKGHLETVKYLVNICEANIEQRGLYKGNANLVNEVAPLWIASSFGHLSVVRFLVEHGADVNTVSNISGATPAMRACQRRHLDIVSYLFESGADLLKTDYNGKTYLMYSVINDQLCLYLLQNGADVNGRDINDNTALHYAIKKYNCHFNAVKWLLDHGADPHIKNRENIDALLKACLEEASEIFLHLIDRIPYDPEHLANCYELLGSTINDDEQRIFLWKTATKLRIQHGSNGEPIPKRPAMFPVVAYEYADEFQTEQFYFQHLIQFDNSVMIQRTLIHERVLGLLHIKTLEMIKSQGLTYALGGNYRRCIYLLQRALDIHIENYSVLFSETSDLVLEFVSFSFINNKGQTFREPPEYDYYYERLEDDKHFNVLIDTFTLLVNNLVECQQLLQIRPACKRQQNNFDQALKCSTHLIYLLVETCSTEDQRTKVYEGVTALVKANPRTATTGDTLLHISVSMKTFVKYSDYRFHDRKFDNKWRYNIFPDRRVVDLLLYCGVLENAVKESKCTPLHTVASRDHYNTEMVGLLVYGGTYLDQPNQAGVTPAMLLALDYDNYTELFDHISLQYLAAKAICKHRIKYIGLIPATLEEFVSSIRREI